MVAPEVEAENVGAQMAESRGETKLRWLSQQEVLLKLGLLPKQLWGYRSRWLTSWQVGKLWRPLQQMTACRAAADLPDRNLCWLTRKVRSTPEHPFMLNK